MHTMSQCIVLFQGKKKRFITSILISSTGTNAKIKSINVNYVYILSATDAIHSSNIFSSLRTVLLSLRFFVTFIPYTLYMLYIPTYSTYYAARCETHVFFRKCKHLVQSVMYREWVCFAVFRITKLLNYSYSLHPS